MADVLYGIRLVRVALLDPETGTVPELDPGWSAITTPQQASLAYQMQAGQRVELRGGDKLLAAVEDDDELLGVDITFTDAAMNGDAWAIIDGGTWDDTGSEYTPRATGTEHPGFACEIYQARYTEGSQHQSNEAGFVVFNFPFCKGAASSLSQQDRQFSTPQFTIKARDSKTERCYNWKHAEALPS